MTLWFPVRQSPGSFPKPGRSFPTEQRQVKQARGSRNPNRRRIGASSLTRLKFPKGVGFFRAPREHAQEADAAVDHNLMVNSDPAGCKRRCFSPSLPVLQSREAVLRILVLQQSERWFLHQLQQSVHKWTHLWMLRIRLRTKNGTEVACWTWCPY